MKNTLETIGIVSFALWWIVLNLTKGLPESLCRWIDALTQHLFTDEIMNMANGFYYDVNNNDMPTVIFLIIYTILFILYFCGVKVSERRRSGKIDVFVILLFAVAFRAVSISGEMIHENDIYRYLWDGKTAKHGINPYKYAPSNLFMYEEDYEEDYYDDFYDVTYSAENFAQEDAERLNTLIKLRDENPMHFERIGHKHVPTIYPPVAQIIFWLSSVLSADSIVIMKLVFFMFEMGTIAVLLLMLKHFKLPLKYVLVYAWSPLVVMQFANSGHYDPVAIFFMMLSIYLVCIRHEVKGALFLCLSFLSKFFAVVLLPFTLGFGKRILAPFINMAVLFYVPYFLWNQTGVAGVFEGLMTYNEQWAYNASIFAVVHAMIKSIFPAFIGNYYPAKIIVSIGYLCFLYVLWREKKGDHLDMMRRCFLAVGGLFIINPVGDPWYYCWVIPFLCFFHCRSWLILSWLLAFSYLNFHNDIHFLNFDFFGIPVLNYLIYGPFFIVLILENLISTEKNYSKNDS